jgi:uncharacterized repeat protein (TIGR02543 family)
LDGTEFNFNTPVTGQIVLRAVWRANEDANQGNNNQGNNNQGNNNQGGQQQVVNRTVTFNMHGGTPQAAQRTIRSGNQIGSLPTPTRSGFTFNGWYTAATGGSRVTSTTRVNANMTVHARWTAVVAEATYRIAITDIGGVVPQSVLRVMKTEGGTETQVRNISVRNQAGAEIATWNASQNGAVGVTANINAATSFQITDGGQTITISR